MTNREWLSKMSDRELAERLVRAAVNDACKYCIYDIGCPQNKNRDCCTGIEAWLREEHKDGEE